MKPIPPLSKTIANNRPLSHDGHDSMTSLARLMSLFYLPSLQPSRKKCDIPKLFSPRYPPAWQTFVSIKHSFHASQSCSIEQCSCEYLKQAFQSIECFMRCDTRRRDTKAVTSRARARVCSCACVRACARVRVCVRVGGGGRACARRRANLY